MEKILTETEKEIERNLYLWRRSRADRAATEDEKESKKRGKKEKNRPFLYI
jgi:hypothetical protein